MIFFFPGMVARHAVDAGIKTPENPDEPFNKEEYPHFEVFCAFSVATETNHEQMSHNAKVIAGLTEDQVKSFTLEDFDRAGVIYN